MVNGLPQGAQFFDLQDFGGLNTQASRAGIPDNDFSRLENMMPIGPANLRSLYGPSTALYTATGGKTISLFQPFNIGTNYFHAVVLSDGSMVQVSVPGAVITT